MIALALVFALVCSAAAQLPTNCGVPAIAPTLAGNKIVSDTEAVKNSWPWQVALRFAGSHSCGASIIDDDWLLTAAHCVATRLNFLSLFSFRAGRHTRDGTNEPYEQISATNQIIVHEGYASNQTIIDNDVALVRLSTPFTFNDYVSPACLADTEPAAGTNVWVSGWGNVEGTCCAGRLKQALLSVVDRQVCYDQWQNYRPPLTITTSVVCAGKPTGYPSACNGDSGGPLVRQDTSTAGKFVQVGVVSFGPPGCRDSRYSNGYANVAKFKPWILNKISQVEAEEALVSRNVHFQPRMGAAFRAMAKSMEAI